MATERRSEAESSAFHAERAKFILQAYIQEHPTHELSRMVTTQTLSVERAYQILLEQAQDPKTHVLRPDILEYLLRYHMGLSRTAHRPFCVVLIDLDHFKQINTELTHVGADELLKRAAAIISQSVRSDDEVATAPEPTAEATTRWGGEEFLVVLDNAVAEQGWTVAERIRQRIERDLAGMRPQGAPVTASGAVVAYDPTLHGEDWKRILQHVSELTFEAKAAGRNQIFPKRK